MISVNSLEPIRFFCICGTFLDYEHMFNCEALNKGKQRSTEYNNIFDESIKEQKKDKILTTTMKMFTLNQVQLMGKHFVTHR